MTREEIIDGLEIYTVGRLNKARVHITVEELQKFIDEIKALSQEPTSEMVHVETLRQVMWERDIAIEQLKELGYSLGQKIEPCEDCISRQYLLDNCVVDKVTMPYVSVNKIKEAPPVKPQEPFFDKLTEIIEPLRHLSFDEMGDVEWQMLRVIDKYEAERRGKE